MLSQRLFLRIDYLLLLLALVLSLIGALGAYSAETPGGPGNTFVRQLVWIGLGLCVCLVVASIDYHFLTDYAFLFYGCVILMLLGVLLFGVEIHGSKSWLAFGPVRFQPSELGKLVLVLTLARYLAGIEESFLRRRHFLAVTVLALVPMGLVLLQGDLGTAAMYLPILLAVALVAGLRVRVLIGLLALMLCLAPAGWFVMKNYQRQRILATLNPDLDPRGVGYQTRQSLIAIGSGGVFGKGIGQGDQSQLGFVPEIHSDFIFSLIAEEAGLIGACVILLLYLLVLMRMVHIAEVSRDRTGIFVMAGLVALIFSHVVVNLGMTLGMLPPIGIPLPLLSYGGSFTLVIFTAIGIALGTYSRRFVH